MERLSRAVEPESHTFEMTPSRSLFEAAERLAVKQGWPISKAMLYLAERGAALEEQASRRIETAAVKLQNASVNSVEYDAAAEELYSAIFLS